MTWRRKPLTRTEQRQATSSVTSFVRRGVSACVRCGEPATVVGTWQSSPHAAWRAYSACERCVRLHLPAIEDLLMQEAS